MKDSLRSLLLLKLWIVLSLITGSCRAGQPSQETSSQTATPIALTTTTSLSKSEIPTKSPEPVFTQAVTQVADETDLQPSVEEILSHLGGLPLDEFFEKSFDQLVLRSPETLTYYNIAEKFGLRNDQLDNLSDAYIRQTQKLEKGILEILHTYDQQAMDAAQEISYQVYEWYLQDRVNGHQFMYHDYPLNSFIYSYQYDLDNLLSEGHPLNNKQDAEDFISRLSQVNVQVDQLMEGLAIREKMGIIPPGFIIEQSRQSLLEILNTNSSDPATVEIPQLHVYQRFSEALQKMEGLTAEEGQNFLDQAMIAFEESYVPAHFKLYEYLNHLMTIATEDAGVWKLPDGEEYYAYLLRHETTTNLTAGQIHEIGLAEVERIRAEMGTLFTEMGYDESLNLHKICELVIDEAGYFDTRTLQGKDAYIEAIQQVIADIDSRTKDFFDLRPKGQVIVIGGPTGGYYVNGAPDGSRPGSYHVITSGNWQPKYTYQTVAYHETIPGHHYQIALAQELNLPTFRNYIGFNGYVEGWAMYAERLAWEMGMYDQNLYGNLGRLEYELLRAVRLVTDTGIHSTGWTRQQARNYIDETMCSPAGWYTHEADRYVVMPAQATGYKIGMIKLLELRQKAEQELGDRFELKEFHNLVLGNGSLPLEILEKIVSDYIRSKLNQE